MSSNKVTEISFLKDVAEHKLTVLRDDGVYRHLRFAKPGTGIMSFNLTTWPGYLAYTGDMGSFVFSRLEDMLQFFRDGREPTAEQALFINESYWAEKVVAEDREGVKRFDPALFEQCVKDSLADFDDVSDALREAVEEEVLSCSENEADAMQAAYSFSHKGARMFHDAYVDWECKAYTYRFVWCCYALAWGVRMYDEWKEGG